MTEETIRVGLIGAGANTTKKHIPGLKAQPNVEVIGVANRSVASGERVAAEFDIPRVYGDWLELLDDDDIDAVCIGTWPYMHHPLTLASLEAGKHVLVEARMAMNSAEARDMLSASKMSPDLVAQIVPAPHTLPIDRTIMDLIADGYVGEVLNVKVHVGAGSNFPNYDAPMHWRNDRDLSGNNIMTMGIWYEALMRWVGPASTVQALSQVVVKHRKDGEGNRRAISIPDHLDIMCRLAGGGTSNLTVTTVSGFTPSMDIWIHGSEGTIRAQAVDFSDPGAPETRLTGGQRGDAQMTEIEVPEEKRGGWRVEEEFINAIRGVEPVTHTNFTDGAKYMEFTDAVTEAYQTGDTVYLPL